MTLALLQVVIDFLFSSLHRRLERSKYCIYTGTSWALMVSIETQ